MSFQEIDCHAPFIAAFGVNIDSLSDFKLVIEKCHLFHLYHIPFTAALHVITIYPSLLIAAQ